MEIAISLELGGAALLIVAAIVFGAVAQFIGETRTGFEWLVGGTAGGSSVAGELPPGVAALRASRAARPARKLTFGPRGIRDRSPALGHVR